jgi:excisionase family DNA binding protein
MKEKEFYTTVELAKLLGISRISVFKRVRRGAIKAQKVGRDFIILKSDVDLKKLAEEIKR